MRSALGASRYPNRRSSHFEATAPLVYSADDGCDVGEDTGAPVAPDYDAGDNAFTGRIRGVQLAIDGAAEQVDHLVSPEQAVQIALSRQ
jgi:arylsulfatase